MHISALAKGGVVLAAVMMFSSCSGNIGGNGIGGSATGFSFEPGEYETTVRFSNATLEGFPEDMQNRMREMIRDAQTRRGCMPISFGVDMIRYQNLRFAYPSQRGGPGGNCVFAEASLDGGRISGSMRCEITNLPQRTPDMPRAITIEGQMTGDYQPNQLHFTGTTNATAPGEQRRGSITVELTTRRVGECPPAPVYTPPPMPQRFDENRMEPDALGGATMDNRMDSMVPDR